MDFVFSYFLTEVTFVNNIKAASGCYLYLMILASISRTTPDEAILNLFL